MLCSALEFLIDFNSVLPAAFCVLPHKNRFAKWLDLRAKIIAENKFESTIQRFNIPNWIRWTTNNCGSLAFVVKSFEQFMSNSKLLDLWNYFFFLQKLCYKRNIARYRSHLSTFTTNFKWMRQLMKAIFMKRRRIWKKSKLGKCAINETHSLHKKIIAPGLFKSKCFCLLRKVFRSEWCGAVVHFIVLLAKEENDLKWNLSIKRNWYEQSWMLWGRKHA